MTETVEVNGHKIGLTEGRSVWAGEYNNSWLIMFTSSEGVETKVRISYEAAEALVKLLCQAPQIMLRYILSTGPHGEKEWAEIGDLISRAEDPALPIG